MEQKKSEKMWLSVVVPCYNERENIPLILERFAEVIQKGMEVVMVDNGSTDGSGEVLAQLLPSYPFARLVCVEKNQGYGYGIIKGLESCESEYVGWTHADMQTDPADVSKGFALIKNQKTPVYVKGNRKGRPLLDRLFTDGMSLFESIYLGGKFFDINAQPNIFPREFYKKWENVPLDFSIEIYAVYKARKEGLPLLRFEVEYKERSHGNSTWNTGLKSKCKLIKRTIESSMRLKKGAIK